MLSVKRLGSNAPDSPRRDKGPELPLQVQRSSGDHYHIQQCVRSSLLLASTVSEPLGQQWIAMFLFAHLT